LSFFVVPSRSIEVNSPFGANYPNPSKLPQIDKDLPLGTPNRTPNTLVDFDYFYIVFLVI